MKTEPKFTLTKFKPEHAYRVLEYLIELKYAIIPRERWDKSIRLWDAGKAFTLMANSTIVGCGGVMIREPGLGEAWIIATPGIRKYKKTIFKLLSNMLEMIIRENKLRRVEALCPKGFESGTRLLEHLRFTNETPGGMKQYGPGGETF